MNFLPKVLQVYSFVTLVWDCTEHAFIFFMTLGCRGNFSCEVDEDFLKPYAKWFHPFQSIEAKTTLKSRNVEMYCIILCHF